MIPRHFLVRDAASRCKPQLEFQLFDGRFCVSCNDRQALAGAAVYAYATPATTNLSAVNHTKDSIVKFETQSPRFVQFAPPVSKSL